jgi:hypothetical protein
MRRIRNFVRLDSRASVGRAVLWFEILGFLRAPALPPSLQAQLEAQIQIAEQLSGLLEQQEARIPTLQEAAK